MSKARKLNQVREVCNSCSGTGSACDSGGKYPCVKCASRGYYWRDMGDNEQDVFNDNRVNTDLADAQRAAQLWVRSVAPFMSADDALEQSYVAGYMTAKGYR